MKDIFSDPAALATIISALIGFIGTILAALIGRPDALNTFMNGIVSILRYIVVGAVTIAVISGAVTIFNKIYTSSDHHKRNGGYFHNSDAPTPLPQLEIRPGETKIDIDTTQAEMQTGIFVQAGEQYEIDFGGCWNLNRFVVLGANDHNAQDECIPPEGHPAWPFPTPYDGKLTRMGTGFKFGNYGEIIQTKRHMKFTINPEWLNNMKKSQLIVIINDTDTCDNIPGVNGSYHFRLKKLN